MKIEEDSEMNLFDDCSKGQLFPSNDVFIDGNWSSGSDDLSIFMPDATISDEDATDLFGHGVVPSYDTGVCLDAVSVSSSSSSGRSSPLAVEQHPGPSVPINKSPLASFDVKQEPSTNVVPTVDTQVPPRSSAVPNRTNANITNSQQEQPLRSGSFFDILTEEERRMMEAEGVKVPTEGPLTKKEERELKRLRRQIKNKYSAKDSRRKRKEYIEQLEQANTQLHSRVNKLGAQNDVLKGQLKHFHQMFRRVPKGKAGAMKTSALLMMCLLISRKQTSHDGQSESGLSTVLMDNTENAARHKASGLSADFDQIPLELKPFGSMKGDGYLPLTDNLRQLIVKTAKTAGIGKMVPDDKLAVEAAMAFEPTFGNQAACSNVKPRIGQIHQSGVGSYAV